MLVRVCLKFSIGFTLILAFKSCSVISANRNGQLKDELSKKTIVYRSSPNGVAEIRLGLKPNHKFKFYMHILPQPGSKEKKALLRHQENG